MTERKLPHFSFFMFVRCFSNSLIMSDEEEIVDPSVEIQKAAK
jgi:hypothetical protein